MTLDENDILFKLKDLHKQATTEHSHFYVAKVVEEAMKDLIQLRATVSALHDQLQKVMNRKITMKIDKFNQVVFHEKQRNGR